MKHEKTFDAIAKLKDVEIELHRLKNALEMANRALDAKRKWVGLTKAERSELWWNTDPSGMPEHDYGKALEAKLKEKNT
jgi:hypothetical protein